MHRQRTRTDSNRGPRNNGGLELGFAELRRLRDSTQNEQLPEGLKTALKKLRRQN